MIWIMRRRAYVHPVSQLLEFHTGMSWHPLRDAQHRQTTESVNVLITYGVEAFSEPRSGWMKAPVNAFYLVEESSAKHYRPKITETTTTEYFSLDKEPPRFFNSQHEQMWQILKDFIHNRKDI